MKCVANYFSVIPKNQGLHKSATNISSNDSKSTNHISLTGTDNYYCNLSKNTARKPTKKLYFWYSLGL